MKMKQVELKQDDGATIVAWIDATHAIAGRRVDLKLGVDKRSPVMEVIKVWKTEREGDEVQEMEVNRRNFGGSIK